MKKSIIIAIMAALPLLAQDAPQDTAPEGGNNTPAGQHNRAGKRGMHRGGKRHMEKFDANKDGQLDDEEKKAMKADFEARKGEMGKGRPGHGPAMGPGMHNKRGHWQGPRTKMPRNPKDAERKADKPATLEIPQE